jgi:hypothetical protein
VWPARLFTRLCADRLLCKQVQEAYKALTGAYEATIGALKHGEPLRGVYEACRAYLERKHPSYVQYLPKSLGSSIGESREACRGWGPSQAHIHHP